MFSSQTRKGDDATTIEEDCSDGDNSKKSREISHDSPHDQDDTEGVASVHIRLAPSLEAGELKIPGAQSGGKKLAMIFTCNICETRSAKQFSERAYNHGVVILTCPSCHSRHLVADRLGYFDEADDSTDTKQQFDLEAAVAKKHGQKVRKITISNNNHGLGSSNDTNIPEQELDGAIENDGVTELTLEDLLGTEKFEKLLKLQTDKDDRS